MIVLLNLDVNISYDVGIFYYPTVITHETAKVSDDDLAITGNVVLHNIVPFESLCPAPDVPVIFIAVPALALAEDEASLTTSFVLLMI